MWLYFSNFPQKDHGGKEITPQLSGLVPSSVTLQPWPGAQESVVFPSIQVKGRLSALVVAFVFLFVLLLLLQSGEFKHAVAGAGGEQAPGEPVMVWKA